MPGLRELARIIRRQVDGVCLIFERRKLARLETALGLLGWQQADYDEETQAHVSRLTDCEREQARLTNESAALGLEILQIEEQRGVAQREFAEAQAIALEKEQPGVADADALAAQIAARRKERKEIEALLPVLDHALSDAEENYRALIEPEAPARQTQTELFRQRKVIMELSRERTEWVAKREQLSAQLAAMETLLGVLREGRRRFEKRDGELADEIATRLRAKRKVEKQIDTMEKAKTDPYREIGRALADHNIAPINQPEALAAVLEERRKIAEREAAIAASLAESAGGMIGLAAAFLAISAQ